MMNRHKIVCLTACFLAFASYARAAGTIYYGSRVGMVVTVIRMSGLDTAQAKIWTQHTRENAIAFCRDYVQKVDEECIQEELSVPLNDVIEGNCKTGEFEDFRGTRYRFLGENRKKGDGEADYLLKDLDTGEIADGSSASGYSTNMAIFKALCPRTAPMDF